MSRLVFTLLIAALTLTSGHGAEKRSQRAAIPTDRVRTLGVMLFPGFELLDAYARCRCGAISRAQSRW